MRKVVGVVGVAFVAVGAAAEQREHASVKVTTLARAVQPGELVVLTITTARPADALRVRALGHDLKSFRTGPTQWQVLVGLDLETTPGRQGVEIAAGASGTDRIVHPLIVRPKTFPTRELKVDDAFVNPPAESAARIKADGERLARAWTESSPSRLWSGPWVRPVPEPANSAFGARSVFNGQVRNPHGGADFGSLAGTPVRSPNAGRVVLAGDLYFTGNTVVIDHGLGLFSLFAHLQSVDVREGDAVVKGLFVGNVGRTGRVTGPHLHWSVRVNDARVDPMSLLAVLGPTGR